MSKFNGSRLVRGRVLTSSVVLGVAVSGASSCEQPQGPSPVPRNVRVVATSTTTVPNPSTPGHPTAVVEVGEALVLERGGVEQVRRG